MLLPPEQGQGPRLLLGSFAEREQACCAPWLSLLQAWVPGGKGLLQGIPS